MCSDAVPLDLEGTMVLPEIPQRTIVTKFLKHKKISNDYLENHLYNHL